MSMLDALDVAAASWNEVEASMKLKGFKHAGFVRNYLTPNPVTSIQMNLNELTNLFQRFSNLIDLTGLSFDEYTLYILVTNVL
ncbi:hypothetical protein RRG08_030988 [Elysia crispata]|uniref:Uncharacterized protein n=1 Tax=Elysia crispata TaxID=231223 RepID=A0AAE1DMI9_9GAST|nr:hypothetical protein RRG08_030988 [Elysia crispata]